MPLLKASCVGESNETNIDYLAAAGALTLARLTADTGFTRRSRGRNSPRHSSSATFSPVWRLRGSKGKRPSLRPSTSFRNDSRQSQR